MIYVTVGKMPLGFERLVKAADGLAGMLDEEMFIQTGSSGYVPKNARHSDFITFPEAEEMMKDASLIISHAGIGTIIGAIRAGTPIVVVPRREKYKEHFNDHQFEIAGAVKGRPGVEVVYEEAELAQAVERLRGMKGKIKPESPGAGLIAAIDEFLEARGKR